jgi:hypothetical protein
MWNVNKGSKLNILIFIHTMKRLIWEEFYLSLRNMRYQSALLRFCLFVWVLSYCIFHIFLILFCSMHNVNNIQRQYLFLRLLTCYECIGMEGSTHYLYKCS